MEDAELQAIKHRLQTTQKKTHKLKETMRTLPTTE
jgi:hypothetical protein